MNNIYEFLQLDLEEYETIFEYYLSYLLELSGRKFSPELRLNFVGAGQKFVSSAQKVTHLNQEKVEDYGERITNFHRQMTHLDRPVHFLTNLFNLNSKRLSAVNIEFEEFYNKTIEINSEVLERRKYYQDNFNLNGFYQPNNSNKTRIKELLNEAIELIESEDKLTGKSKKSLIDYLEGTIKKVDYKYSNWTDILGRIKQISIILASLGTFAVGATKLYEALTKLEESTEVIQKTSININNSILTETFKVQDLKQLEEAHQAILLIEPSTKKEFK